MEPTLIESVVEGWNAPGYRDPVLHLQTQTGEIVVRLTPRAFVDLLDILATEQDTIDTSGHNALDWERERRNPRHQFSYRALIV